MMLGGISLAPQRTRPVGYIYSFRSRSRRAVAVGPSRLGVAVVSLIFSN